MTEHSEAEEIDLGDGEDGTVDEELDSAGDGAGEIAADAE